MKALYRRLSALHYKLKEMPIVTAQSGVRQFRPRDAGLHLQPAAADDIARFDKVRAVGDDQVLGLDGRTAHKARMNHEGQV